jgi:hypothetical protein
VRRVDLLQHGRIVDIDVQRKRRPVGGTRRLAEITQCCLLRLPAPGQLLLIGGSG